MPELNVAEIVNDPDFAQWLPNGIARDSGSFVLGKWVTKTTLVDFYGVIQPATAREIKMVPEGDRVAGMISFHSSSPLYVTRSGDAQSADGVSDIITWHSQQYRLLHVAPWSDFGYFLAVGVRMSGK